MAGRTFSPQTWSVLGSLTADGFTWRHGYGLAKETGLKSGTLYPILIRLADRGLIEASWEDEQPVGRPRRHLYRLTAEGMKQAQQAPVPDLNAPAPRRLAGRRRRLAGDHG